MRIFRKGLPKRGMGGRGERVLAAKEEGAISLKHGDDEENEFW